MKLLNGLSVIEYPYCYNAWSVEVIQGKAVFNSQVGEPNFFSIENYRRSQVFQTAGVPFTIKDILYQENEESSPYQTLTRKVSDSVCNALKSQEAVLFVGGYCNFAPAIAGGIQRAIGVDKKIGVIWIDAHGDCRIPDPAGHSSTRLVSVPMSVLSGIADPMLADYRENTCGLKVPCSGQNIIAGDIRIMDEETGHNLMSAGILKLDASEFRTESVWKKKVNELAQRVDAIYMSVDADILKHEYIPAYCKNVPFGQELDITARNVADVAETGKLCALSLFCFQFGETGEKAVQNCQSAIEIMKHGLSAWKQIPI